MHRLIKKLNSRDDMVRTRTPCCDQTGVKKGAWTPEEDRKLIAYLTRYGHWNWRLLPKFAGLARSGKSCRLRWMNYLRPDVKRGSYTREEEDTIIRLHEELGNRWSMIAAHLPGRTDNQIKNHWHTNLKKRFLHNSKANNKSRQDSDTGPSKYDSANSRISNTCPMSSQAFSSKFSSITTSSLNENLVVEDHLPFLDASFWTEPFMVDISYVPSEAPVISLVTEPEYYSPVCDISNDHLYPKDDFAFLDAFAEPEPMSTNFLTDPHMVDISSDPSETLVPMMSEPEYFSPLCDATKEKSFLDAFTEPVSANCLAEPYAPNEAVVPLMSESECFSSVWNANNENLFLEEAFTNPMGANFSTEPYMVDISNVPSECDANKENLFVEDGCFSTFWDA